MGAKKKIKYGQEVDHPTLDGFTAPPESLFFSGYFYAWAVPNVLHTGTPEDRITKYFVGTPDVFYEMEKYEWERMVLDVSRYRVLQAVLNL